MLGDILLGGLENDYEYFSFRKIRGSARSRLRDRLSRSFHLLVIKTEKYFSYRTNERTHEISRKFRLTNDKRFHFVTPKYFSCFLAYEGSGNNRLINL